VSSRVSFLPVKLRGLRASLRRGCVERLHVIVKEGGATGHRSAIVEPEVSYV
jgi:hypothetical protein